MTDTTRAARIAELRAELAALEAQEPQTSGPLGVLREIGETLHDKECKTCWANAPLETINKLKPDTSGKLGELFTVKVCAAGDISCEYDEDINSKDGTYDAIVNGKLVEIKTARLGAQGGFQHESLRAEGCDAYLFIDILPSALYLTVLKKFTMTERHPILGRTPHLRKGATDVYKFDWTEMNLQNGVRAGVTLKVTESTPMEMITEFLRKTLE